MGWQRPPARTLGFRAGRAGESTRRANRQPPRSRRRSAKHRGRPRRRVHHLDDPGPSPHRRRCSTRSSSILHPGTPRSRHPVCNAGTPRPTRSLPPFLPSPDIPGPSHFARPFSIHVETTMSHRKVRLSFYTSTRLETCPMGGLGAEFVFAPFFAATAIPARPARHRPRPPHEHTNIVLHAR